MILALLPLFVMGQDETFDQRWEELNEGIQYKPSKRPKGPEKDYISPQQFNESKALQNKVNKSATDDEIITSREKRFANGSDKGVKKHIKDENDQGIEDLSTPDTDAPKVNPPGYDGPDWDWGDGSLIKFFLISIAILLLVFLIYHFFFKNASKPDQKIGAYIYDEDNEINPETIQKSKLEIDLDQAIAAEDYRTAIRIYYIMLLKALIERNWIKWAKRKTNSHYSIEMSTQEEATNFNKAVLMYEWSWYGKNLPNKATFERFSTFYSDFLNRLKDE